MHKFMTNGHRYDAWHRDRHDVRDFKYTYRVETPLRPYVERLGLAYSRIEDQGSLGSCTGQSSTSAIEIVLKDGTQLSRLMAYYNARVLERTTDIDNGAMIRDVIKGLIKTGVATERTWPYVIEKFDARPSSAAYREAHAVRDKIATAGIVYERVFDLDGVLHALNDGDPVVFGFTVFESFEKGSVAVTGIAQMPRLFETALGGHAVTAVGYDLANRYVWVQNSWGKDWGIDGYFKMPFDYFTDPRQLVADLWAVRAPGVCQ